MRVCILATALTVMVSSGCGSVQSPLQPQATLERQTGTTPALARLGVSRVGLDPDRSMPSVYRVHFRIHELSGLSGMVIKSVAAAAVSGSEATDACWGSAIHIEAGGVSDDFAWRGPAWHCAPTISGLSPWGVFTITIAFVDDFGRPGRMSVLIDTSDDYFGIQPLP